MAAYLNLNNNEISKELLVNKFNMILDNQGRLVLNERSCRPDVFFKKGLLRNFAKFTGKHLCQSLFFNKVAGIRGHPY